jgi:sulfur carrier protein
MTVTLNDKTYGIAEGTTLAAFIATQGLKPEGIAVAINNTVVPKKKWADTVLSDGQELILIRAVSGG